MYKSDYVKIIAALFYIENVNKKLEKEKEKGIGLPSGANQRVGGAGFSIRGQPEWRLWGLS